MGVSFSRYAPWADYRVLETDYVSFALVYSKYDGFMSSIFTYEFIWVLTRDPLEKESEKWIKIK